MTPSAACAAFIQGYEKCRLTAYMPTPQDRPTIGWGTTGPDVKMGMTWTQAQADARFAADLAEFARGVEKALNGSPCNQAQFDALVSLAYNIGLGNFATSTLLKRHRAAMYADAEAQFSRWNKQKGRVLNGLTLRRAGEAALYRGRPSEAQV